MQRVTHLQILEISTLANSKYSNKAVACKATTYFQGHKIPIFAYHMITNILMGHWQAPKKVHLCQTK